MPKYKVLGRGKSGSYFVECLLTEASIDYEFETYSFDQTKEIEFKSINPLSRTPVLIAPSGQIIIESVAIFAHLIETFPTLAPQVDTAERNAMWQQLGVLSTALFATWFRFHNTQFIGPEEIHQSIIDYIPHEEKRWLDYLENQLNPYLSGSSPMAVDFYFYMMTRWTPDRSRMLKNRPNIDRFISMMSSNNTVMTVNERRGIKEQGLLKICAIWTPRYGLEATYNGTKKPFVRLFQEILTASNCSLTAFKSYPCPYFDPIVPMDDQPPI